LHQFVGVKEDFVLIGERVGDAAMNTLRRGSMLCARMETGT